MNDRTQQDVLATITSIVHAWDPYALLAGGAPTDEFDREIEAIYRQRSRITSPLEAAKLVSDVFGESFEPGAFTLERCQEVGERLHAALVAGGPPSEDAEPAEG